VLVELRVSISGVRTLGSTLKVVSDNGGFLVIFLLKAFSVDRTFFKVRTQDQTMLVRPDDDSVDAQLPSCRPHFGEAYLGSRCCHHRWCYCCYESLIDRRCLYFIISSSFVLVVCIRDVYSRSSHFVVAEDRCN
jgi:hypothetical protein